MFLADLRRVDSRPFPVAHLTLQLPGPHPPHLVKTRADPMTQCAGASLPGRLRDYVADLSGLWYFWKPAHLKAKCALIELAISQLQMPGYTRFVVADRSLQIHGRCPRPIAKLGPAVGRRPSRGGVA